MKERIHRTRVHIYDRIAQRVHGTETIRKNQRDDEDILGDIRVCVSERFRDIQWR